MPKKPNSEVFALKKLYEAIRDGDEDYQAEFLDKGFGERQINSGVDRIGAIEQGLRFIGHDISRAQRLIHLINRHDRRLKKFMKTCELSSRNFFRAVDLQSNYQRLKEYLSDAKKILQAEYRDRDQLRRAYSEELGVRLKQIRRRMGYTQEEVARELGITQCAYSHYEIGRREIPPAFLYQLINLFDVPAAEILRTAK